MIQNNIQVFKFNSNIINLISKDGEIWFIAKEVCEILGISKYRDAILKLDEDEKNICPVRLDGWSQKRNIAVINESGLYALILRSVLKFYHLFVRLAATLLIIHLLL